MADENWQVGDLALCVTDGSWFNVNGLEFGGPRKGSVNSVRRIEYSLHGNVGLYFDDWPGPDGYQANNFRRIAPHAPDAEDNETIWLQDQLRGEPVEVV